jgi:hypothetical protein
VISRALRLEFDNREETVVEVPMPDASTGYDVGASISLGSDRR